VVTVRFYDYAISVLWLHCNCSCCNWNIGMQSMHELFWKRRRVAIGCQKTWLGWLPLRILGRILCDLQGSNLESFVTFCCGFLKCSENSHLPSTCSCEKNLITDVSFFKAFPSQDNFLIFTEGQEIFNVNESLPNEMWLDPDVTCTVMWVKQEYANLVHTH